MKLGRPVHIAEGIWQVRALGSRVTAVESGDGLLLVDASSRGSLAPIRDGLASAGLPLDRVSLVAVTHHHPDHTGGLRELVDATGAPVAAHPADAGVVSGAVPAPNPFRRRYAARMSGPAVARLNGRACEVVYEMQDGAAVPGFDGVVAIHTPGHTPGSVCIYLPDRKALIVGDALQNRFGRRLSPPSSLFTEDAASAMRSLRRLLELEFETIVFSHFPPVRSGARDALSAMLEGRRR